MPFLVAPLQEKRKQKLVSEVIALRITGFPDRILETERMHLLLGSIQLGKDRSGEDDCDCGGNDEAVCVLFKLGWRYFGEPTISMLLNSYPRL